MLFWVASSGRVCVLPCVAVSAEPACIFCWFLLVASPLSCLPGIRERASYMARLSIRDAVCHSIKILMRGLVVCSRASHESRQLLCREGPQTQMGLCHSRTNKAEQGGRSVKKVPKPSYLFGVVQSSAVDEQRLPSGCPALCLGGRRSMLPPTSDRNAFLSSILPPHFAAVYPSFLAHTRPIC